MYTQRWRNALQRYGRDLPYVSIIVGLSIILGVVTPYLSGNTSPAIVVNALFLLILLLPLQFERSKFDYFAPISLVILLTVITRVIPALNVAYGQRFITRSFAASDGEQLLLTVIWYSLIGIVSLYLGYYSPYGSRLAAKLPSLGKTWHPTRVPIVVIVFSLVGLTGYYVLMEQVGGFTSYITNLALRWTFLQSANLYWLWGWYFFPIASFIWLIYSLQSGKFGLVWLHILVSLGLMASLGSREHVFLLVIVFLVSYNYLRRKISIKTLIVILMLILLFSAVGTAYREATAGGFHYDTFTNYLGAYLSIDSSEPLFAVVLDETYSGLDVFMLVIRHTPDVLDFQYGKTLLNVLAMPVPRSIWPDKPVMLGRQIGLIFFPGRAGGPLTPFIAELYLNFHWFGIVIGMLLLGVYCRMLYAYLMMHQGNGSIVLLYGIGLLLIFRLLTGDFAHSSIYYFEHLLPILLALKYVGIRGENKTGLQMPKTGRVS